jgi:hypothetical protein
MKFLARFGRPGGELVRHTNEKSQATPQQDFIARVALCGKQKKASQGNVYSFALLLFEFVAKVKYRYIIHTGNKNRNDTIQESSPISVESVDSIPNSRAVP